MHKTTLFLISILYLFSIAFILIVDRSKSKDRFSAVKLFSYFSLIEAFVMTWFSIKANAIERLIFPVIASEYRDYDLVIHSYFISIYVYLMVVLGIYLGSNAKKVSYRFATNVLRCDIIERLIKSITPYFLYAFSLFVYILYITKVGGLSFLWGNLNLRTTLSAGLSYYQTIYTFLITLSTALLFIKLVKSKRYLYFIIILSLSIFVLSSTSQRYPTALLIFILILLYNYKIKKIPVIFNWKILSIALALLFFGYYLVQFRVQDDFYQPTLKTENFENDIIKRMGVIERQVVVLGYFKDHPYWGFGNYQSLIYAPIPRTMFAEKPPVDTGVYLNNMRLGNEVSPPMPVKDLYPTSWPDEYLAGYMSFGILGLGLLSIISGFFYGLVYVALKLTNYCVTMIVIYGHIGFMGVTALSPLGIVQIGTYIVYFIILAFMFSLKIEKSSV